MSSIKVGLIGLGDIGLPVAKSLVGRGLPLTIYSRREEVAKEMKLLGAIPARSCRDVGAASDVIVSVVRDIPQTEEIIFGKDGVWEGIKEGAIIVIASTVGPAYCQQLNAKANKRGVQIVDAALSKSGSTNEEGEFTLMIGGEEGAVKRCQPVFEAMAKHTFHLGGIGTGQTYKLVNQLAQICNSIVTMECLNLGLKAGLDPQLMIDVIRVSSGNRSNFQSLDYLVKSRQLRPAAKASKSNAQINVEDLLIKLANKVGANTPLLRLVGGLDTESIYDAYAALTRQSS